MNGNVISLHQPPTLTPQPLSLRERGDEPFPGGEGGTVAAPVARLRVQLDFGTWLGKLERTLRWLDRHQIEVVAFACSTMKGGRVHAAMACAWRLRRLLSEEANSRGHCHYGERRIEQWEARDPSTGVLICWEEECRAGGRS